MVIFDSSLIPIEEREAEFRPVLSAVLEPLINACTISATPLGLSDVAVFLINCLHVMQVSVFPRALIHLDRPGIVRLHVGEDRATKRSH